MSFIKRLLNKQESSFGIQTSKGIIYVSKNPTQSPLPNTPAPSKESQLQEFKKKKTMENELEKILEAKVNVDFKDITVLTDTLKPRGSKELEIILNTIDFLKQETIQKYNSQNEADVSLAEKSELIVWIYKELREQRQRNCQLRNDIEIIQCNYDDKLKKIDVLHGTIRELKEQYKKLNKKYNEAVKEVYKLKRLVDKSSKRCIELTKMQEHELSLILKENKRLREQLNEYIEELRNASLKKERIIINDAPIAPLVTNTEIIKESLTGIEQLILNNSIGSTIMSYIDIKGMRNLMLMNKRINVHLGSCNSLTKIIYIKLSLQYTQQINQINENIKKEKEKMERLKKEFDVQSDPEMPRIYQKYIAELQSYTLDPYIEQALRHSRRFVLSQKVYEMKKTDKGFIGNVIQAFSKNNQFEFIEVSAEDIKEIDKLKLKELEKIENLEQLYKGLQLSIESKVEDQNEVNKWFYNLQLCFCENYIALANLIPIVVVKYRIIVGFV